MINYAEKAELLQGIRVADFNYFDKSFIPNMQGIPEEKLTEKQKENIDRLLYKYRRQIAPKNYCKAGQKYFIERITKDVSKINGKFKLNYD